MRIFGIIPEEGIFGDFEAFEEYREAGSLLKPRLVQLALLLLKDLGLFQAELAEVLPCGTLLCRVVGCLTVPAKRCGSVEVTPPPKKLEFFL